MRKIILILIGVIVGIFTAYAQKGNAGASIGLDVALPVGNMAKVLGVGIGGSVKGFYGIKDETDLTITLGYIDFAEKSDLKISYSLIPILLGYRLNLDQVYIEPQLGFTTMKAKTNLIDAEKASTNTKMSYGIGAGYLIGHLDVGLRYQDISANGGGFNILAIRLGYNFAF